MNRRVKGWRSEERRLRFVGVEDRGDAQIRLTTMFGRSGEPDFSILTRTFRLEPGEPPQVLADRVAHYVTSAAIVGGELALRSPR